MTVGTSDAQRLGLPFERSGDEVGDWETEAHRVRLPAGADPATWCTALVQILLYRYTRQPLVGLVVDGVAVEAAFPAGITAAEVLAGASARDENPPGAGVVSSVRVSTPLEPGSGDPSDGDPSVLLSFAPDGTSEDGGSLLCRAGYRADRLTAAQVRRMCGHLGELAAEISRRPESPVGELGLLTAGERELMLGGWNDTAADRDEEALLHDGLVASARRSPTSPAVVFRGVSHSYGELDAQSDRWAARLREAGVRPGDIVGVCVERSAAMVARVVGVLKAGATYLPLDPSYPLDRLRFMLADSGTDVVAAEPGTLGLLTELGPDIRTVLLTDAESGAPRVDPGPAVDAGTPAFLIYTSGSTGRPKGVAVSHRAALNFVLGMAGRLGVGADDVVLAQAPLSFDISVFELFIPLAVGARIHLVDRATAVDGTALAAEIAHSGVTVVQGTATTHRMLLAAGWQGDGSITVVSGGEPLPTDVCAELLRQGVRLWNSYGPTETTVYTHALRMTQGLPVRLGGPLPNVRTYLLDEDLQPVPVGVPGEIHLAGTCLANGYLGRPDLTAERFLPDPFANAPGQRIYRSGDLGRWREDGELESLGRIDQQVKLRGYRIELGEVEAALRTDDRIGNAVVVLRTDEAEPFLAAYVVLRHGPEPDRDELRALVASRLPGYMVPARFIAVDRLPLTPSGKADRAAVLALRDGRPIHGRAATAPRSALEQVVAGIWLDLLGSDELGVAEPVFEAGATSLTVMRAAQLLQEVFDTPVPVRLLFDRPTVEAQARYLAEQTSGAQHIADRLLELVDANPRSE